MKKILPQANNLDTLVNVFIYFCSKKECTLQDISDFCNFDIRQASYYLSACLYLGLINEKNEITQLGNKIYSFSKNIKNDVFVVVISSEEIAPIFAHYLLDFDNARNFAIQYLSERYPEYSDAVIVRRTSTLLSWCETIKKYSFEVL